MADKKISALTSKASNLESTDIFAIAEDDGAGSYVSKGITGDEIKNAITEIIHNAQTSTSYTLVLGDRDKLVELDNASAITLTVPTNSSVAFPIGTQILLVQKGAGQVTIQGDTGVTVYAEDSRVKTVGQYAMATLVKCASDTWYLGGNLEA
jgi:hypothetical protein